MKTKRLSKKLTLKKETITNLKNGEMKDVNGGEIPSWRTCLPSWQFTCTCTTLDPTNFRLICCVGQESKKSD